MRHLYSVPAPKLGHAEDGTLQSHNVPYAYLISNWPVFALCGVNYGRGGPRRSEDGILRSKYGAEDGGCVQTQSDPVQSTESDQDIGASKMNRTEVGPWRGLTSIPEIWPVHGDYYSLPEFSCPLRLECNDGVEMDQH